MLRIVYVTRKLLAHLSLTLAMKNGGRVAIQKYISGSRVCLIADYDQTNWQGDSVGEGGQVL